MVRLIARRVAAASIDGGVLVVLIFASCLVDAFSDLWQTIVSELVVFLAYPLLVSIFCSGTTVGKLVWGIRLQSRSSREVSLLQRVARYVLTYSGLAIPYFIAEALIPVTGRAAGLVVVLSGVSFFLLWAGVLVATSGQQSLWDILCGTEVAGRDVGTKKAVTRVKKIDLALSRFFWTGMGTMAAVLPAFILLRGVVKRVGSAPVRWDAEVMGRIEDSLDEGLAAVHNLDDYVAGPMHVTVRRCDAKRDGISSLRPLGSRHVWAVEPTAEFTCADVRVLTPPEAWLGVEMPMRVLPVVGSTLAEYDAQGALRPLGVVHLQRIVRGCVLFCEVEVGMNSLAVVTPTDDDGGRTLTLTDARMVFQGGFAVTRLARCGESRELGGGRVVLSNVHRVAASAAGE